jgi:hypothetical protein
MPTASHRVLLDFFQNHLPFTPTPGQIDQFERDLALVSPNLMRAALKEAHAGRAVQQGSFAQRRAAIFRIYYRKVAEHAQLFPIFHTFETAFRSTVAVELEALMPRLAGGRQSSQPCDVATMPAPSRTSAASPSPRTPRIALAK